MCTVSFVPTASGLYLTSSRDEQPHRRPRSQAAWHTMPNGAHLYYPTDAGAGGTWMAARPQGDVLILLNGAFEKHVPQPPYRRSRGLVFLELFQTADTMLAFANYDLQQIEPFTLVLWQQQQLCELRWDGEKKHAAILPATVPHVWSSATLYNADMRARRQQWFAHWCQQHLATASWQDVWNFHLHAGDDDTTMNIRMKRPNGIETISISSVQLLPDGSCHFQFADLLSGAGAPHSVSWQADTLMV